jgi:hypothetical protein
VILTEKGKHEVVKAIRQEKKERSERPFKWMTLTIGLGGMLMGLIAVLKS